MLLQTGRGYIIPQGEITLENCGHSERLLWLASWAATRFGLWGEFVDAAQIHDAGKLYLPRYDLLRRPLKASELEVLRSHVALSWQHASKNGYSRTAQDVALMHHERWDGKGYILGRGKEEIPLSARVMAVLDAYDAMRSGRPYREALSPVEARREIRQGAGTQFDPQIAGLFLEYLEVEWPDC
ncbi:MULTISPECIES: HD-GYP domain-containing protein [Meiothermus]|jgi:HD-GYP domain-containing protein (c-di-GMP phosphodiesterase class II)|uniref:Metal dependent phosphohydrolase n=1 Tax=Meiothermus ruber (strain ATCC 35948 / DSM 1279 / VKM B-1258 / 21) TaxID=504728 RepID=D3PMX6_MEIRD|nr:MULTISPECIES: HD domain-containing phosphohydrolase [Meiothermus]ADD27301.1 metal dependent phosphohydrolase [Meiothermus ruber DSM 1279]AGK03755.1 metal dependent phosphohydrolase [Meiothermus ruber DSM 1279]GIW28979.1 MAG: hypothetical protein KatS3mg070_2342 [Meiothermus sp.]